MGSMPRQCRTVAVLASASNGCRAADAHSVWRGPPTCRPGDGRFAVARVRAPPHTVLTVHGIVTLGVVEAFEQFVALALENEGLVVSGALKFPVRVRTTKAAYEEWQTHGFEVDLVGARSGRLVLATVKSFFGSRGVVAEHVRGDSENKV